MVDLRSLSSACRSQSDFSQVERTLTMGRMDKKKRSERTLSEPPLNEYIALEGEARHKALKSNKGE